MGGAHLPRVPGQEYADEKPRSRAAPTVACAPSAEDERKAHIARTKLAHVAQDQLIFSAEKPGAKAPPQASALPATKHRYTTPVGFKPRYTTPVAPCAPHSHQQRKKGQRSKGRKHSNSRSGLKPSPRLPPESHPLQQQERIKRCPVGGGAQEGVEAEAVHGDKDQQDHEWAINESTVQRRRKVAKVSHDMLRDSRCGAELEALKRIFQREHFMGNSGAPSSATALAANGSQAGSTSNSAVTVSSSARSGGAVVAVAGGAAGGPAAAAGCALYALLPKLPLEQYSLLEDAAAVALTRCKREVAVNVQDESFQVFAKALTGWTVTVDVKSSDTIWEVLLKTSLKDGVPAHFQRVGYRGSQLDPSRTVASCGIRKETTLHLSARVRGGMQIFYPYGKTVAYNVDPPVPYATSNAVPVPEGGKASHLYAVLREDDPLLPDGFTIKWMHKDLGKWVPLKDAIDRDIPPRGADLMICAPPTVAVPAAGPAPSSEDFDRRVRQKVAEEREVDETPAWAKQVLSMEGLTRPAPDAESLGALLFAPPPHALPLIPRLHIQLLAQATLNPALKAILASHTTATRECDTFAYALTKVLELRVPVAGASEIACLVFMSPMTDVLMDDIAMWAGAGRVTSSRDQADASGYTASTKRPDLILFHDGRMVMKKEYKKDSGSIQVALKECAEKMVGNWSVLVFGSRAWLLCAGTAGTRVQFAFVPRGAKTCHPIGRELDLSQVVDRITYVGVMVNILRLAIITKGDTASLLQLGRIPRPVTNGCSVVVHDGYVVKHVTNFLNQPNSNHDIHQLRQLYKFLGSMHPPLVGIVRSMDGKVRLNGAGNYTVNLIPLGHSKAPSNEAELRTALRQLLEALAVLHAAGWVLRDVREDNILCGQDGCYFFTDLEGAGRVNTPYGSQVTPALLVNGTWPPCSDMRLVGGLFPGVDITPPPGGTSFRERLVGGEYADAASALTDEWFSR